MMTIVIIDKSLILSNHLETSGVRPEIYVVVSGNETFHPIDISSDICFGGLFKFQNADKKSQHFSDEVIRMKCLQMVVLEYFHLSL